MSVELSKQMIFDVAMELLYGSEGISDLELATKLMDSLEILDKEDIKTQKKHISEWHDEEFEIK